MRGQFSGTGPRYEALMGLLRTAEALWNASRVFFARWNLSPSQFNILNLLHWRTECCTQIELSRQLIMHRSNVTGLVDRLEKRGLVRRLASETDRRAYHVALAPRGRKLVREILPHYYRAAETVLGGMPVERAKQLLVELTAISASAEKVAGQKLPAPKRKEGRIVHAGKDGNSNEHESHTAD